MKNIADDDFLHPLDRELSKKIYDFQPVSQFLDVIFEEGLDEINQYIHSASGILLPLDSQPAAYLREGCSYFGVNCIPRVYLCRSYMCTVACSGFSDPVVVVPNVLLEKADAAIIRGRMMAAAASIRAGHHKLSFLLWILENFQGLIPIPLAATAIKGLLYEWKRAQEYSIDRAFLLSTGDYSLALKNILYGETPDSILKNFVFGEQDTFDMQVAEFYRMENAVDAASKLYSLVQCESWLPARYHELKEFCRSIGWEELI